MSQKLVIKALSNVQQKVDVSIDLKLLEKLLKRVSDREHSNCWGTTAYIAKGIPELKFIPEEKAKEFLKTCMRVRGRGKHRFGDIIAIYANNEGAAKFWGRKGSLLHTAICVGRGIYFHQQGAHGEFKVGTLEELLKVYPGNVARYRARDTMMVAPSQTNRGE